MVRKIGGSDIYCELKETNRRMCKVTKNKTKNSDDCEYRKETKKCYIINKKKTKSKNPTQIQSEKVIEVIDYDFQQKPSYETIRKYREFLNKPEDSELLSNNPKILHDFISNIDTKQHIGDFWFDNSVRVKTIETLSENPNIYTLEKKLPVKNNKKTILKSSIELPVFNLQNYELINVPADGNCGYHSFIQSMNLNKYSLKYYKLERDTPDKLRMLLYKKLSNSKDSKNLEVIKRIKGGINQKNIEQDFWLEQEEFELLASIFKVCIHIWDSRGNFWTYIPINYKDNFDTCINKQQNIYIYADGIHYQTLKRKI